MTVEIKDRNVLPEELDKPDEALTPGRVVAKQLALGQIKFSDIGVSSPYWDYKAGKED